MLNQFSFTSVHKDQKGRKFNLDDTEIAGHARTSFGKPGVYQIMQSTGQSNDITCTLECVATYNLFYFDISFGTTHRLLAPTCTESIYTSEQTHTPTHAQNTVQHEIFLAVKAFLAICCSFWFGVLFLSHLAKLFSKRCNFRGSDWSYLIVLRCISSPRNLLRTPRFSKGLPSWIVGFFEWISVFKLYRFMFFFLFGRPHDRRLICRGIHWFYC